MAGPIRSIKAGAVELNIWQNQSKIAGQESYLTFELHRIYKDTAGKWARTNSFRQADLPKVELVTRKAFELVNLREKDPSGDIADPESLVSSADKE